MRQPGNRAKEDTASATGARVVRSAAWRAPRYPTTATPPGPNTVSRVTRFAGRDPGPSARVAGFLAHLRDNGLRVGVAETATALKALTHISAHDPEDARRALRTICAGCREDVESFDALFDAYWLNEGRVRQRIAPSPGPSKHMRSTQEGAGASGGTGALHSPDDGTDDGQASGDGEGKLIASRIANLMKKDLRDVVSPQDIRAATRIAERLGRAIRDRRSRRRKAAARGARIDFRRVVRRSLATGGEPLALPRRHRPDRPVRIVALCDVSGSMTLYAPVYLAFLAGLSHTEYICDTYVFHTRLVRISEALRDPDPMRAMNRLTLLSEGFGGGSRIGAALEDFADGPARRVVNGRTAVMILSDGYDTDPAGRIGTALERLKRRGCRVIWLNPLKGWRDYAPIAGGMAAALPHLDLFAAAGSLAELAALEPHLEAL